MFGSLPWLNRMSTSFPCTFRRHTLTSAVNELLHLQGFEMDQLAELLSQKYRLARGDSSPQLAVNIDAIKLLNCMIQSVCKLRDR